jgi:hypothetical protein
VPTPADSTTVVDGSRAPSRRVVSRLWHRLRAGPTRAHRLLVSLGAAATAVAALASLVAGGLRLVDRADGSGAADRAGPDGVVRIEHRTASADAFVALLLDTAASSRPIALDHQVIAPTGDGHYRLEYDCATGCEYVRLETPEGNEATIDGGVWFRGCWEVAVDGAGYGADHLDLALRYRGATCP